MSGELTPMPLTDILAAVGYRTAMGVWPPGFDEAHALLTLVNVTERLRLSIAAHHDADRERMAGHEGFAPPGPCPVCVRAQGAEPDDVLTDNFVPPHPLPQHRVTLEAREDGTVLAHCPCGWEHFFDSAREAEDGAGAHLSTAGGDPRGG